MMMATTLDAFPLTAMPDKAVAIIAGSGKLPELLAAELSSRGQKPIIARLAGEAGDWALSYPGFEIRSVEIGRLVKRLKARNVERVVLAGGVRSRPPLRSIRLDWITLRALPMFYRALRQGDDALLRTLMTFLESHGFHISGAHEVLPTLLARQGNMTARAPDREAAADIAIALSAARKLGRLDKGQGAVAAEGRVMGVEGADGTEALLQRAAQMRAGSGDRQQRKGVLVKTAKPHQDMRADLPSIGPETIDQVAAAGLAGIALGADCSLILEYDEVIRRANLRGVFVTGINPDDFT